MYIVYIYIYIYLKPFEPPKANLPIYQGVPPPPPKLDFLGRWDPMRASFPQGQRMEALDAAPKRVAARAVRNTVIASLRDTI